MIFTPPAGYSRIKLVSSFDELLSTKFEPEVNALCWARQLEGNFDDVAAFFKNEDDIVSLGDAEIDALRPRLGPAGLKAAGVMLDDLRLLRDQGLQPSLECVPRYLRDETPATVHTDVYSFHADRATVEADTYLCSYNEAATEGLRNEEAQKHIHNAETRAALQAEFMREGGGDFALWLEENCYDLHYAEKTGALPFSFGFGNLWRIAVEYPGSPVPPCVHRAPKTLPGRPPRLLLIS